MNAITNAARPELRETATAQDDAAKAPRPGCGIHPKSLMARDLMLIQKETLTIPGGWFHHLSIDEDGVDGSLSVFVDILPLADLPGLPEYTLYFEARKVALSKLVGPEDNRDSQDLGTFAGITQAFNAIRVDVSKTFAAWGLAAVPRDYELDTAVRMLRARAVRVPLDGDDTLASLRKMEAMMIGQECEKFDDPKNPA